MNRRALSTLVLALLIQVSIVRPAAAIDTADIVEQTASAALACLRWMPVGMCFWLQCSLVGCSIETAIKVGHYNPDLVVSVYNELGGNPWDEIRATLGFAQRAAATGLLGTLLPVPVDSAGNRTEGSRDRRDHNNLVFREADAIGHPVSSVSAVVGGVGLVCESQATSFVPSAELATPYHCRV